MTIEIICPVQQGGRFDPARCHSCNNYTMTISGSKTAQSCRKNGGKRRKNFESVCLAYRLGLPDTVEIVNERKEKQP